MSHTISIGAVVFHRDGEYLPLMGQERKDALWAFYRREDLGDLVPHGDFRSGDFCRPLVWEDVYWLTLTGGRYDG